MMMSKRLESMASRLAEARCICRAFSTHSPRLQTAVAPAPAAPPTYYNPQLNRQKKSDTFKFTAELAQAGSPTALKRVSEYNRMRQGLVDVQKNNKALDLERQMHRKWKAGDVYAPHDLSSVEMTKWRKRRPRERDAFDQLGINPLHEYKNFSMMSEYTTPMGRIKHRKETGLRAVNQRKIAKAIRRAVGMGLLPSVHKHPEVLEVEARERNIRLMFGRTGGR
ncbi:hypothetical protein OEA41_002089 [Lepraria neglecta]|uniref:Small ribosomal subunit protein bS18m n=1 Tax=Lepraria neglecta TaxID=209136 RepID=A0AAE0DPL7_9LECA|nr:hypothetical protein OEA41_002089 [Lepraria neglecta]